MYRVGFYQFNPRFGRPDLNLGRVLDRLRRVSADLVVLPELAFSGYSFRDRAEATALAEDPRTSPTVDALVALCRQRGFHLVTGFAERRGGRVYNTSLLLGPRGIIQAYRKIHLFNEEKRWFDPGNGPLEVRRVGGVRLGMMICFDWVFPEVMRTLALRGAEVVCHPSNLVLRYCQRAMQTRCLENGVFAITTNRFGTERRQHGALRFTGGSQIVDPRGALLARARAQREELTVVALQPSRARDKRLTPRNHLIHDRRPRFYRC